MALRARHPIEKPQLENHRNVSRRASRLAGLGLLLFCSGCAWFAPKDKFGATRTEFAQLAGWQEENHAEAIAVFVQSCEPLSRRPRPETVGSGLSLSAELWQSLCNEAKWSQSNPLQAKLFFEQRFVPYRVNNRGKEEGLFTGYYEPVLFGSRRKQGDFRYPLYRMPPEAQTQRPYFSHAEINAGALAGRGLELAWVDDPVMLFFLQIQGSGRLRLDSGQEIQIGYAGGNGHPYVSLGKVMGDEGLMPKDQINFFTLRQYLYANPEQAFALMERNPSYVFFKELPKLGAVGSVGVVLTPQRSLAIDPKHIPYGLPLYLQTAIPNPKGAADLPFRRLMVAQDTGGAIRSPVRGDIFFGPGNDAEFMAGNMKGRGGYALLVPREMISQLETP
jgi:membrane-bound lytic murein transglycosylase A